MCLRGDKLPHHWHWLSSNQYRSLIIHVFTHRRRRKREVISAPTCRSLLTSARRRRSRSSAVADNASASVAPKITPFSPKLKKQTNISPRWTETINRALRNTTLRGLPHRNAAAVATVSADTRDVKVSRVETSFWSLSYVTWSRGLYSITGS